MRAPALPMAARERPVCELICHVRELSRPPLPPHPTGAAPGLLLPLLALP